MSGAAIRWARAVRGIDVGAKALLLLLADYADEAGSCYPGQQALAADSCQSERTVRRQLEELEEAGLLTRQRRARTGDGIGRGALPTRYYLALGAEDQPATVGRSVGRDQPAKRAGPTGQTGRTNRPKPATNRPTVAVEHSAVDPPAGIHQQGSAPPALDLVLVEAPSRPAPTFADFWQAYPRHEKKRDAEAAWKAALDRADAVDIVAGARRYAADPNREPTYTAHPGPWLRADRWEDDPLPPRAAARPTNLEARLADQHRKYAEILGPDPGDHRP